MNAFVWGTVTAVSPLRVRLDGDVEPLPLTPELLVSPLGLAPGDRVRCELADRRVVVHGRAGGGGTGNTFPVGAIIDWPYNASTPAYALDCDGRAVSRSTYSALFGTIGTYYGGGDGTTTFNVPTSTPVRFSASLTNTNPASSSYVVFDQEETDAGSNYDHATGVFLAPRTGEYEFSWGSIGSIGGTARMVLRINNVNIAGVADSGAIQARIAGGSNYGFGSRTYRLNLAKNDTVRIWYVNDGPTNVLYGASSYTWFMGRLLNGFGSGTDPQTRQIIVASDQGSGVTIVQGQGQFLGQIIGWPGHNGAPIPANCLELNGQTVSASTYSGLAALFPGWVSGSHLVLPDLRGRTLAGYLSGDSDFGTLGGTPGAKTHKHGAGSFMAATWAGFSRILVGTGNSWTATNSNNLGFPGASASTADGGPAIVGESASSSSIQPSYVGRWLIVAADSAGEYNPTVQAALTARVSDAYVPRQTLYFRSSGTFSKASYPWLRAVRVRVQGGGGGGGGSSATGVNQTSFGQGGGGGGYAESFLTDITGLAGGVVVTVGAGGTGGTAGGGASGGASSFGTLVMATGGGGGWNKPANVYTAYAPGGAPGTGTAGDLRVSGQGGATGTGDGYGLCTSGAGGASILGGGGASNGTGAGSGTTAGNDGGSYGGGGGGATSNATAGSMKGGSGAPGIVIVEMFA